MTVFRPPAGASRRVAVAAAQEFFDAWVAALPARAVWFRQQAADRAGLQLDGSLASLDDAEAFVQQHLGLEVPGIQPPSWRTAEHTDIGWSDYGAALVEGLTAYVAELLLPATGSSWRLDTEKISAYDLQPVLTSWGVAPPWRIAQGSAARFSYGIDRGSVRDAFEHILAMAATPTQARGLVAEVALIEEQDWDAEVQIPDAAESVLGTEAYATLEDRIAAVPGVLAAQGEDREIFLVRLTPEAKADPEQVRAAVQAVLDELVEGA